MKVTFDIDIPETLFKVGDKIKINNWENDTYQHVLISKVIFTGTWAMCEECSMSNATIDRYNYEGVIQINSWDRESSQKIPIRPGTRKLYPGLKVIDKENLDSIGSDLIATIIDKFPHKEVSIDTKENIHKRQAEWRSTCSTIAKSGDWNEYANKCQQE